MSQILRTLAIEVARSRPNAIVVGLHPGTVSSGLSQPFRPDPTATGVFSPEESAAHLLRVLNRLRVYLQAPECCDTNVPEELAAALYRRSEGQNARDVTANMVATLREAGAL